MALINPHSNERHAVEINKEKDINDAQDEEVARSPSESGLFS